MPNTDLTSLTDYTRLLQDPTASPGDLRQGVNQLADFFGEATSLSLDSTDASAVMPELALPFGTAIAPPEAARCMRDFARTVSFHRGIRRGIETLLESSHARPLHVVYAGCGPFGTLAVPLMHLFRPDDVQFHLWDSHRHSLDLCRRLVTRLDLETHVAEYRHGDASIGDMPIRFPVHMLVIETMQAALAKEPQVGLTAHLAPHLEPDGILVPERIRIVATMLDPAREFSADVAPTDRLRVDLGDVFVLDRESACVIDQPLREAGGRAVVIPAGRVTIPDDAPGELWLRTHIRVFGRDELGDSQSGLTIPRPAPLDVTPAPRSEVVFRYEIGPKPGLRCEVIGPDRPE